MAFGKVNENGMKFLEFCAFNNLVVVVAHVFNTWPDINGHGRNPKVTKIIVSTLEEVSKVDLRVWCLLKNGCQMKPMSR